MPEVGIGGLMGHAPSTGRCAVASLELDEDLLGSAPTAAGWLLVEHPGPWGPKGWLDSGVPDGLTRRVQQRCDEVGVRIQLVRRHAVGHARATTTRITLARTNRDGRWLRHFEVGRLADLEQVPIEGVTSPRPPRAGRPGDGPVLLVCTHGRRDACCAQQGRGVAARLAAMPNVDAWETTHTGGHRFAPNVVVLPDGTVYGRVTPACVGVLVSEHRRRRMVPDLLRGSSDLDAWGQAAEGIVRQRLGLRGIDDVDVVDVAADGDGARVVLRTAGGRHVLTLVRVPTGQPRPFSCGDDRLRDPGRLHVRTFVPG